VPAEGRAVFSALSVVYPYWALGILPLLLSPLLVLDEIGFAQVFIVYQHLDVTPIVRVSLFGFVAFGIGPLVRPKPLRTHLSLMFAVQSQALPM